MKTDSYKAAKQEEIMDTYGEGAQGSGVVLHWQLNFFLCVQTTYLAPYVLKKQYPGRTLTGEAGRSKRQ